MSVTTAETIRPFTIPVATRAQLNDLRARIENTREVPLEFVVNGKVVATTNIIADGRIREMGHDATGGGRDAPLVRILEHVGSGLVGRNRGAAPCGC